MKGCQSSGLGRTWSWFQGQGPECPVGVGRGVSRGVGWRQGAWAAPRNATGKREEDRNQRG